MNLYFAQELPKLFSSVAPDDNTIAALGVLLGAFCGWYLANLGALGKRARAIRKSPPRRLDD